MDTRLQLKNSKQKNGGRSALYFMLFWCSDFRQSMDTSFQQKTTFKKMASVPPCIPCFFGARNLGRVPRSGHGGGICEATGYICMFKFSNYTARLPFGSTQKRKVMTASILYKIYREILFQKVALGYLLHIVQNESSNCICKHTHVCTAITNIQKIHSPASIWEHRQNVKL